MEDKIPRYVKKRMEDSGYTKPSLRTPKSKALLVTLQFYFLPLLKCPHHLPFQTKPTFYHFEWCHQRRLLLSETVNQALQFQSHRAIWLNFGQSLSLLLNWYKGNNYPFKPFRLTRPRSWCKLASPSRSAPTMTMVGGLGSGGCLLQQPWWRWANCPLL